MPDDDMVLVRRDDLRAALVRVSAAGHWDLADDSSFARLLDAVNGEAATVEYADWQYGVIRDRDGLVWGCGFGEDGRRRQQMRLRYSNIRGACLIAPLSGSHEQSSPGVTDGEGRADGAPARRSTRVAPRPERMSGPAPGAPCDDAYVESKRVAGEREFTPEERADILARRSGSHESPKEQT